MTARSKRKKRINLITVLFLLVFFALKGNWRTIEANLNETLNTVTSTFESDKDDKKSAGDKTTETQLAELNYISGEGAVLNINNGKSTLNFASWKKNQVIYSNLDALNRTATANTAYLEPRNIADDSLRERQYIQPTGWHQKLVNKNSIINRGHLIAYSLSKGIAEDGQYRPDLQSGDQNNPKNLFTQTAFANQRIQTVYESKVRTALKEGHKVIYYAHAIFRSDELMARGIHLQALSDDGSLNFNVFIYNVQPNIKFDYATGRSVIDKNMQVPVPNNYFSLKLTNLNLKA
ncbi:DNA/RNA non-specific endonuclease [Liquorilactobacillus oeni]|uniref:DNA RNA non-specific endonuclease n=1 Tax=Liquorilactobacillus oeni DSM 19972 TaxID=1423777 RepID=A0A0R1MIY8_9LACO|nr:DNA/RNA non-specific endonuclease [Liquorilactobacillus oeni]KRL04435.1 DNA RNA non-specific endonuclease [Liquorilactobacillus oeni DSM 19972]